MIYGFISSLDDETTKVFFRSKKIRVNNIYSAGSLGAITSVLQSGDVFILLAVIVSHQFGRCIPLQGSVMKGVSFFIL